MVSPGSGALGGLHSCPVSQSSPEGTLSTMQTSSEKQMDRPWATQMDSAWGWSPVSTWAPPMPMSCLADPLKLTGAESEGEASLFGHCLATLGMGDNHALGEVKMAVKDPSRQASGSWRGRRAGFTSDVGSLGSQAVPPRGGNWFSRESECGLGGPQGRGWHCNGSRNLGTERTEAHKQEDRVGRTPRSQRNTEMC